MPTPSSLAATGLFLALCACLTLTGCHHGDSLGAAPLDAGPSELPSIKAEVVELRPQAWATIVHSQGTLAADEEAVVGAKVSGRVAEVLVDLGDSATADSLLVKLDDADFKLEVAQAEAALEQARAALGLRPDDPLAALDPENAPPVREQRAIWDEARDKSKRYEQLRAEDAVTASDYEEILAAERVAEARYASALNSVREKIALIAVRSAELAVARQRLSDTTLRAPFDGAIQQRHVAPGTFVQVGAPLITLVRANPLRFRGTISERSAQRLKVGQPVSLRVESLEDPLSVTVTRISPALDHRSRSLLFEAEVDNNSGKLRSGLFAEASIELTAAREALVVPERAVSEFAGTEKVWKVVDGVVGEQIVETGERRDGMVELITGIAPGDVILRDAEQGQVARLAPESLALTAE